MYAATYCVGGMTMTVKMQVWKAVDTFNLRLSIKEAVFFLSFFHVTVIGGMGLRGRHDDSCHCQGHILLQCRAVCWEWRKRLKLCSCFSVGQRTVQLCGSRCLGVGGEGRGSLVFSCGVEAYPGYKISDPYLMIIPSFVVVFVVVLVVLEIWFCYWNSVNVSRLLLSQIYGSAFKTVNVSMLLFF